VSFTGSTTAGRAIASQHLFGRAPTEKADTARELSPTCRVRYALQDPQSKLPTSASVCLKQACSWPASVTASGEERKLALPW
jgi:hypothetical protein